MGLLPLRDRDSSTYSLGHRGDDQVFVVRFLAGEKEFSVLQNQDPQPVRYSGDTICFHGTVPSNGKNNGISICCETPEN